MITGHAPSRYALVGVLLIGVISVASLFGSARSPYAWAGTANAGPAAIDWSAHNAATWKTGWRRPAIGSSEWLHSYPSYEHGPAPRTEWLVRYHAAKAAGRIVDVPVATLNGAGVAEYPAGVAVEDKERVCSYRRTGCFAPDDIVHGPPKTWAINYDDGPLPPSATLHRFLDSQREHATRFFIGHNVKRHWQLALDAVRRNDHLAVHTWSHAHLTTYTDEQVIGELGWTIQIIYDVSGHVARYLRPPYGDTDMRVRSLAREVFGLRTVIWNHDSDDWALNQTYAVGDFLDPPYDFATPDHVRHQLALRMEGDQGVGVNVLEHELSEESVGAFIQTYSVLAERGWRTGPIPSLYGLAWYN